MDFSSGAFGARLCPAGTHPALISDFAANDTGTEVYLKINYTVTPEEGEEEYSLEEFLLIEVGKNSIRSEEQARDGFQRVQSLAEAMGWDPATAFESYEDMTAKLIGQNVRLVVAHGTKRGLKATKIKAVKAPE